MKKYLLTSYENFGIIDEVENLKNKQYEIIDSIDFILELMKYYTKDIINFDKTNNRAITSKPEQLQKIINDIPGMKDYKIVFCEIGNNK